MMKQNQRWKQMLSIMKTDIIPATGCTEPIALALAAATAASYLTEPVISVNARVSANLMKNGMGVMVPGTGKYGLVIAVAVGAIGGDEKAGLQVLHTLTADQVGTAETLIQSGHVSVAVNEATDHVLYAEAEVFSRHHSAKAIITDSHDNIVYIEKDGEEVFSKSIKVNKDYEEKQTFLQSLSIKEIVDFAESVPLDDIRFMKEAELLNKALSKAGLTGKYGLGVGYAMSKQREKNFLGPDLGTEIMIRTVAASDARMGGAVLPAMTNSGSGNQGIVASVPVTVVADYLQVTEEERIRALALAGLMAIYAHGFLPKLSAFCATVTAAMGVAAGMAWLLDKNKEEHTIEFAIVSMTGDLAGMVCDGAADSCAMKVSSAVAAAYKAVMLALQGIRVKGTDGLVANSADESLRNVGKLASKGMQETDREILHIMMNKNQA